jgi:hypothetical protein
MIRRRHPGSDLKKPAYVVAAPNYLTSAMDATSLCKHKVPELRRLVLQTRVNKGASDAYQALWSVLKLS